MKNLYAQDYRIIDVVKNIPENSLFYGMEAGTFDFLLDNPQDPVRITSSALYTNIERKAISDDYISVQTSNAGNIQIKLLPLVNDSYIICVVTTVCGLFCDSQMAFYTDKWKPITSQDLMPGINPEWFLKDDQDKNSEAYDQAKKSLTQLLPVQCILHPDNLELDLKINPKAYVDMNTYATIKPFLIDNSKKLIWNKKSFVE